MLTASQDIDNFIERQRSKLNSKPPPRPSVGRQPPPPPSHPPNENVQDRLDFKVARILDEPPPRLPPQQQPYYPAAPPPSFQNNASFDQQDYYSQPPPPPARRFSNDNTASDDTSGFFNKFGTYDDKRSQLKEDLKREYNEYLQGKKGGVLKSKSTSQLNGSHPNAGKRVQFQQPPGKVVAPWEKGDKKTPRSYQSMNDVSSTPNDYASSRPAPLPLDRNYNEQYIRDREDYVNELHAQIRELETKKRQLEIESNRLSGGSTSNVVRAHYTEDLNALNSLLAERLDQRNAVDLELARILNRPPISGSPTPMNSGGMTNLNMPSDRFQQGPPQKYPQQNARQGQSFRNDNRKGPNEPGGLLIGQEADKDAEQAAKKRYQQELQAQIREAQMRKAEQKRAKEEYDRKLEEDIQRYNYFGRSGGGAPMRDKDGNVVANLADVRNPQPPQTQRQQQHPQQQFAPPDGKVYSLGDGFNSFGNAPFYNGEPQSSTGYGSTSDRPGSPNHARGALSNGLFGTAKSEAQLVREEKYKQDLKKQIEEKRQREVDELNKRRAEEDRELAKHQEWQQQMEKQMADEALRKEKEQQERLHQQHVQEELDRQKRQDEVAVKRKPKRQEKLPTPRHEEFHDNNEGANDNRQNSFTEPPPPSEPAYRSSSPPVPTIKNKDKKQKKPLKNTRSQPSLDDPAHQQSPSPFPQTTPVVPHLDTNDNFAEPPLADDAEDQVGHTYRKPPTPRQPDVTPARKKPPTNYRSRPRANSNSGLPIRTNSNASLRSDGSDSEVLNRLEHLKRQLKDKEARLQDHVNRHQAEPDQTNGELYSNSTYQPPIQRKPPSPQFLINAPRVHRHSDGPMTNGRIGPILPADDDPEFKPGYFRDDAVLMRGQSAHLGYNDNDYYSSSKRVDSANRLFDTNIEREASRRRYGQNSTGPYEHEDPTVIANFELNRIAEQNEARLKKLRDLEHDDASLLDSNEVLERFQQRQRMQRGGSQATLQDDAWLK